MKKLFCLLLVGLLLCGCGAVDPLPMDTVGETRIEGKVAFTLADFYRAEGLTPAILTGDYPIYEAPEGLQLWVAVVDVENLTGFGANPKTLLPLTLTAGESRYTPTAYLMTDRGAILEEDGTVAPQSAGRVVYVFAMPAETESATMTATVAGQPYTATVTPNKGPKMERTSLGSTLVGNGLLLKPERFFATQKLKPSDPAPLHDFFDAGSGKIYLVVETTAFNNSDEAMDCTRLAGVTVGTTPCTPIMEEGGTLTSEGTIPPGESRTVYFAAPFGADQSKNKATVTFSLYGDTYRLTAIPQGEN